MRRLLVILLLLGLSPITEAAESLFSPGTKWTDFPEHAWGDLKAAAVNPSSNGPNWLGLSILALSGTTSYALYKTVEDDLDGTVLITENQFYSTTMNTIYYSSFALPFIFLGSAFVYDKEDPKRTRYLQISEEFIEAYGYTLLTIAAPKFLIQRQRPTSNDTQSFPSGHAAASFAAATLLAYHFPWYVGASAFVLASLISIERFDDRAHFPSDLIVGAGVGAFWAQAVHAYHRHRRSQSKGESPIVISLTNGQPLLSWQLRF